MKRIPKKVQNALWTALCLIAGNVLLAFLVAAFVIPLDVLMGGSTGISILITKAFSLPETYTWFITLGFNIFFLLLGLIFLGKKFFFTTIVSSILYPVLLGIFQRMPWIMYISDSKLLSALIGGALLGMAIGIVIRVGASSGGTDAVVLILHKYLHLPVAVFVYITDAIILSAQAIFFGWTALCYGIVLLGIESIVLNKVMILGKSQIQIFVVSGKYDIIRTALLTQLDAGVTMVMVQTGQLEQNQKAAMCVIPPRKLFTATRLIHDIDPAAFITVSEIKEVRGRGFTEEQINRRADRVINARNEK